MSDELNKEACHWLWLKKKGKLTRAQIKARLLDHKQPEEMRAALNRMMERFR